MSDPESAKSGPDGSGGAVNCGDLARFRSMFGKPVGPSGTAP